MTKQLPLVTNNSIPCSGYWQNRTICLLSNSRRLLSCLSSHPQLIFWPIFDTNRVRLLVLVNCCDATELVVASVQHSLLNFIKWQYCIDSETLVDISVMAQIWIRSQNGKGLRLLRERNSSIWMMERSCWKTSETYWPCLIQTHGLFWDLQRLDICNLPELLYVKRITWQYYNHQDMISIWRKNYLAILSISQKKKSQ